MANSYRFNALLDSLRLVRGVFLPTKMDPYIERWPARVRDRQNLFQWSMILQETGSYTEHYPNYSPYQSSQPLLMQHLPERYGRDAFSHWMNAKAVRIQQITTLLESDGIRVEASDECWQRIIEWMSQQWVPSQEPVAVQHANPGFHEIGRRPISYSLLYDLGLLLGEHAIELCPHYQWMYWGDVPMTDAHALGRTPWVLCEPLPESGTFTSTPKRFLPVDLVSMSAGNVRNRNSSVNQFLSSLCKD